MYEQLDDIIYMLRRPFPADKIRWRVGATTQDKSKGIALAYIDARDAMKRLDDVVGPASWQDRYPWSDGGRLVCEIGIRLDGEWVWKSNGAGDTQVEAEKGAFSDAFKRAAVMWGVGRYLYSLPNEWVELDDRKRIKNPPALPTWAIPNEFQSKRERDGWITSLHKAWADRDLEAIQGVEGSLSSEQKLDIWGEFTPTQRREIKTLIAEARGEKE